MNKQEEKRCKTKEIADRMEKGAGSGELIEEFTQKWGCGKRTVERFIAFAKDRLLGSLNDPERIIEYIRAEKLMDEIYESMLSGLELEARLCSIASGLTVAEKVGKGEGGLDKIDCRPSHSDQLKAIALLLRMKGMLDTNRNSKKKNSGEAAPIYVKSEDDKRRIENI